jgi:hypothetical protein
MVSDEIVVEGSNIAQDRVEAVICRHLGLPGPEPKKKGNSGTPFGRISLPFPSSMLLQE